ncbi:MAG: hypothetical protein JNK32_12115 [Anaerolineales bacterium]|nr:hypothetical protein [Anaerolineales bacterium]
MSEQHKRILNITLSILGVMLILIFGLRVVRAFKKLNGHRPPPPFSGELETDVENIEDWMTIPFIAHNYGVTPEILFEALNIDPEKHHKQSLKQLNDEFYPEQDGYVLETVKQLILAHQPPPTPAPPAAPLPPLTPVPPDTPVPPQSDP